MDPTFGTTIIRVTDESDGDCTHADAYWPALNHDENRLLISCGNAKLYTFNPTTGAVAFDQMLDSPDHATLDFQGATWSFSSPDILFALESKRTDAAKGAGRTLYEIDLNPTHTRYQVLREFSSVLVTNEYLAQLSTDQTAQHFGFSILGGPTVRVAVWSRQTNTFLPYSLTSHVPNEIHLARDGKHAFIEFETPPGALHSYSSLWNFEDNTEVLFDSASDDIGGHYDLGTSRMVNGRSNAAGPDSRTFVAPRSPTDLLAFDCHLTEHFSLQQVTEATFISSTYVGTCGSAGLPSPTPAFTNEIYWASTTEPNAYVRLAHTRSTATGYFGQPRASLDMKGRFVVYTSDLHGSGHSVFILKLPTALWP